MKLTTRVFGEVEIEESKIITFPNGIIGFPDMTRFTLMHDEDQGSNTIKWLQSIDEPNFAMPVMDPLVVCPDYKPVVDKAEVEYIGNLSEEEMLVLVTVTVPHDLKLMTVNLKGPFIINTKDMKASQTIIDNDEYPVKFPIYDILQKNKEAKG
ncbi:flagellar assembly factor FliW [Butyrivibrio hungatei DSM 14810]|uniref:Flagellar assembly factor FliW n=2 Tax=Butyrivibrio hungatei TaxID=185008 RepID=A0A1D9P4U9_9FIRM|nr:flagellar assembly protein FliW [Butyrivibrio hungatei]AOZ97364.1 flagellar assembly protein FliW [Butyrivibrio hungatei]SHN51351.1 flagellar assembly factor FliW [Butyrivibrio hungatei DSM 14810]